MKSLLSKLGVLFIGLLILGNAEAWGADWKLYGFNDYSLAYYDAQNITRPSKNIVKVWIRRDFTEKGVIDMVGSFGKKYENVSHLIAFTEINCLEKTLRNLSITSYDNKGGVIYFSDSLSKWEFIIPESTSESLYKEVCK